MRRFALAWGIVILFWSFLNLIWSILQLVLVSLAGLQYKVQSWLFVFTWTLVWDKQMRIPFFVLRTFDVLLPRDPRVNFEPVLSLAGLQYKVRSWLFVFTWTLVWDKQMRIPFFVLRTFDVLLPRDPWVDFEPVFRPDNLSLFWFSEVRFGFPGPKP